jgi:hypothetical protein
MPLMEVHFIAQVFNPEQKHQMIRADRKREHARRDLDQDFGSRERRMGHRRPASDHRSGQGSRGRTKGGGVNTVRNSASPCRLPIHL